MMASTVVRHGNYRVNCTIKQRRLLDQINAAPTLDILRIPPSNRLEKLKGDWAGFWSMRINDQWRIVFRWQGQNAFDVQVTDYH